MKIDETNKVVRDFITAASTNSNNAIKNVWLILFTAGTFSAISQVDIAFKTLGIITKPVGMTDAQYPLISILAFAVYFLTFFRFYVGDIRIFDIRYNEILHIINNHIDCVGLTPKTQNQLLRFLDYHDKNLFRLESVFLVFQTVIIVYLAFQILYPENFIRVYILLMVLNASWLILSNRWFKPLIFDIVSQILPGAINVSSFNAMFPRQVGWVWVKNNLGTALILIAITMSVFAQEPAYSLTTYMPLTTIYWIAFIVILLNCLIDLHLARDFYFPRFSELYVAQSEIQKHHIVRQRRLNFSKRNRRRK